MRSIAGLAVVCLVSVAGCHSAASDAGAQDMGSVGESQAAIQGGDVDAKDAFAVGIVDRATSVLCSGALIAPNLVLTARHCIAEIASEAVRCATDTFGAARDPSTIWITSDVRLPSSQAASHRAKKLFMPDDAALCGNDIALIELEIAMPEGTPLATPALERPLTDPAYDRAIAAIGYGAISPAGRGAGTRRIRENIAIACIPGDAKIACPKDDQMRASEFVTSDGTCQGDSGSSAFEQRSYNEGRALAMGVLSRGGQDRDADKCIGAVYTRVDAFRDLIVNAAIEAARDGHYAAPAWTNAPRFELADAGFNDDDSAGQGANDSNAHSGDVSEKGCAVGARAGERAAVAWVVGLLGLTLFSVGRRRSSRRRR